MVAEGVEQPDLVDDLFAMGCDLAQGYAIAMPQPASAIDLDAIGKRASRKGSSKQLTKVSLAHSLGTLIESTHWGRTAELDDVLPHHMLAAQWAPARWSADR